MSTAVKWFRRAAERGHARAQYDLGVSYSTGDGVPRDTAVAAEYFRQAAEQADPGAQYALGDLYLQGVGNSGDADRAAEWFHKAAEVGDARAQTALGIAYAEGILTRDETAAVRLLHMAAEQGNDVATKYLRRFVSEDKAHRLKDRAATFKSKTLVFGGLYLGMPVADAVDLLNHGCGPSVGCSVETKDGRKSMRGRYVGVDLDVDGNAIAFSLSKWAQQQIFESNEMVGDGLLGAIMVAYGIPSLTRQKKVLRSRNGDKVGVQSYSHYRDVRGFEIRLYGSTVWHDDRMRDYVEQGLPVLEEDPVPEGTLRVFQMGPQSDYKDASAGVNLTDL